MELKLKKQAGAENMTVTKFHQRWAYLENNWVDVLSQKVEKEPVSNIALANDGINAFFFYPPNELFFK